MRALSMVKFGEKRVGANKKFHVCTLLPISHQMNQVIWQETLNPFFSFVIKSINPKGILLICVDLVSLFWLIRIRLVYYVE